MPPENNPVSFNSRYAKARYNFLTTASESATLIKSWQHPLRGIAGEKLYLDLAWFGSLTASKVLITISGTHGVEGYCGSGIQVGSIKTGWHLQADQDVAIAMIHALNPYGMSHLRRVNEDGVDLNRNFIDFTQPLPKNTFYEDLAEVITPEQWTESIQTATLAQIINYLHENSLGTEAIAQGQYQYWYAPFYGGEAPTWSNRIFNQIVDRYLLDKQAIGLLDYHTGLGQYATGQLMSLDYQTNSNKNLAAEIWGDKLVVAGSQQSVAPYSPKGTLIATLPNKLNQSICMPAVYEFGTIPETEVFEALRADHWLQAHGDLGGKQALEIKQNMLYAFYCDSPDWQKSVCSLAFAAQEELLAGLRSL